MDEQTHHQHEIKWAEPLPIENAMERRAICLRMAVESEPSQPLLILTHGSEPHDQAQADAIIAAQADAIIATAKRFEQYVAGVS